MSSAKLKVVNLNAERLREPAAKAEAEQVVRSREIWAPVIEAFESRAFPSAAEAADAVAEALIARMGWTPTSEIRDFVALILETDPESESALSRLVARNQPR